MPPTAAEEYRIAIPEEEDLEHPAEELQEKLQERLAEWQERIDQAIAAANETLALDKKGMLFEPKLWGEEFAAAANQDLAAREAELKERCAEGKISDPSPIMGYSREPREYDQAHNRNMLHFALRAADETEFATLAERRAFAALAAEQLLEELIAAPYHPDSDWHQVYEIAAERLTAQLSAWSPAEFGVDRRPDQLLVEAVNSLSRPALRPGQRPEFYLWVNEEILQDNPPGRDLTGSAEHFTAENYQNREILGDAGQELIDNLLAALQERWPDTVGYPGMEEKQWEREFDLKLEEDDDGRLLDHKFISRQRVDTLELLFTDMREVFRRQEFASREDYLSQSGEIARAATEYLEIPEDSPAGQLVEILQDRLSCFLTETQLEPSAPRRRGDRVPFQYAAELKDLAEAAALYAASGPERELDYALMLEQGISARAYMRGSNEYLPLELLRMHAANNFQEGLEAYGLHPRSLHFDVASVFLLELKIDPQGGYPFRHPQSVSDSYGNLLRHAIMENHETLRGGIECINLLDPNPDAEMLAWREEIGYHPRQEKDPEHYHATEWQVRHAAEWEQKQTEQRQLSAAMARQAREGDADNLLVYDRLNPAVGQGIFDHLSEGGKSIAHPLIREEYKQLTAQVQYMTRDGNTEGFRDCGPQLTAMGALQNLENHWQRIRQAAAAAAV